MNLKRTIGRRQILSLGGKLIGASLLAGCGNAITASSSGTSSSSEDSGSTAGGSCASVIPSETEGPYPAHDDNAINCLRLAGIVRSDIRSSLNAGAYTGTATASGIPLTMKFTLTKSSTCSPLAGYALYIWHSDANGKYSMYSSGFTNQTYLRGVQVADANGQLSFTTIVPGCYAGRYPHIHFEIYPSLALAVDNNNALKTSQLTFPSDMLTAAYGTSSYATSRSNLAGVSLSSDGIFSDGYSLQIASATGDTSGYTASLIVGI